MSSKTHENSQDLKPQNIIPDFPINDPKLKKSYTKAFLNVYGTKKKSPITKYDEIDKSLKYVEDQQIYTASYHIGQRKLLLCEIQFLTNKNHPAIVVYAGAAPSNKGALLASLFPNIRFLLIDPAKFDIRPYGNIIVKHLDVNNDIKPSQLCDLVMKTFKSANICTVRIFMTAEIAKKIGSRWGKSRKVKNRNRPALYFISDIRTNMIADSPTTFDILWNSAQHIQWVHLIKAHESMLKFRLPFFNEPRKEMKKYKQLSYEVPYTDAFDYTENVFGINMRTFKEHTFIFFEGYIYIQPWAPISSTESRLVFTGVPGFCEYDLNEYENRFFYYNKILRNYQLYKNPCADKNIGFDHCADCALEAKIWVDYCNSVGITNIKPNVISYVKTLSDMTYRPLLNNTHGNAFKPIPVPIIENRFREYRMKNRKR